ncbi:MAG: autotransporter outer membrane beta-barrel domain-containing protein [Alphaproteobacteria bacterium]|nr:autotransporter outer membrane beta-barrel domain-containing protein [Alphaproteobacteria bacterium]
MRRASLLASAAFLAAGLSLVPASVHGQGIIDNGLVAIGINPYGDLITSGEGATVGLRFIPTGGEALAPGCFCEGWGVADFGTALAGGRSQSNGNSGNFGPANLTFSGAGTQAFSNGNAAISIAALRDGTNTAILQVTHDFRPSSDSRLIEMTVTIQNVSTGTNVADLRYRRVMDWDVPPTTFNERVTLQGFGNATALVRMTNNGFNDPNPNTELSIISTTGLTAANTNVVRAGPDDHGAGFDFAFGALAPGQTVTFKVYYGAAANRDEALAALAAIGAEVFSLGEQADGEDGSPNVYIFAFTGVGGTVLPGLNGGTFTPAQRATFAGLLQAAGQVGFEMARARFGNIQQRLNGLRGGAEVPAAQGMGLLAFNQPETVWSAFEVGRGTAPINGDLMLAMAAGAQAASGSGMMPLFQAGSMRGFLGASYNFGQIGSTPTQRGAGWRGATLTLGADMDIMPNVLVGAALSYSRNDANLHDSAGSIESDSYALTLYGSGTFLNNLSLDAMASVGFTNYEIERNHATGRARGSTSSIDYGVLASASYNIEADDVVPGLVFGPLGQIAYLRNEIRGYTETGTAPVTVRNQQPESWTVRLGMRAQYNYHHSWGTLMPNIMVGVEHELLDGARRIDVLSATGSAAIDVREVGRTYMVLGAGLSSYIRDLDAIISLQYEGQQFRENLQSHAVIARGRMRF